MWNTAAQIGSGLALTAFAIAAIVTALRYRLKSREQQLKTAPESDRAALVQSLNDTFLVPSLPYDPRTLPPEQGYNLLLEQIRDRARRFYVTAVVTVLLAILIAAVTIYALSHPNGGNSGAGGSRTSTDTSTTVKSESSLTTTVAPKPPEPHDFIVTRNYKFDGPFRVGRTGDNMTYSVTDAAIEPELASKKVLVETVTFKGYVSSESSDALGLDYELLAFPDAINVAPKETSSDLKHLGDLERLYADPRRLLNLVFTTDWGRTVRSKQPIVWSVDLRDGAINGGKLKEFRKEPYVTGTAGLVLQLLMWSGWGGDHYVELNHIELTIRYRVLDTA